MIEDGQSNELEANEVRIKTAYAGVSFTDKIIQDGLYKYQRENMPLPYIPGFEASGVVTEVGGGCK
jgi:NADPH:quinone reductase-like Zn-dependent oxidoreductase